VSNPCQQCDSGCCGPCLEEFWKVELRDGKPGVSCPSCQAMVANPDKLMRLMHTCPELPSLLREARDRCRHSNLLDLFEADPDLASWAMDNRVQACPRCCSLIQLTSGCNHITCRCTQQFCFGCGGAWDSGNGHSGCSRDKPRLSVTRNLLSERRVARRLAVLMATHPRLGAASPLAKIPSDVLLHAICSRI